MQGEKVKIRIILTIMVLMVFWGINTAAAVINQWMAKTVAPQIVAVQHTTGGLEIELLGYRLDWREEYWEELAFAGKQGLEKALSLSKLIIGEFLAFWRQLQGKFFFKDGLKSAILDIAVT